MAVYIDPPVWPGHGRMWSHLISDVSYAELHEFAERIGVPRRGFDRDHYDLPSASYAAAVEAGAIEVSSKELVRRLTGAGLRRPKRGTDDAAPLRDDSLGDPGSAGGAAP
ncbi:DUF4031 domain-containing protein [Streptomyces sp. AC563]|uniref:DUF4031 domain-containing protein n=1 Tax=Streptomyces buecherae TaxID=2763006 RepID=UPI00164E8625|nr:DUF4031 domain-containing protein [Streptomyces buecherae]MBC3993148.1 DUF4031 domain-containing protein [Streptomyces buecherae]